MVALNWEVSQVLPLLRRYARAMTGDRELGDANVRACLESLLPRAGEIAQRDMKLQLYRALHDVWRGLGSIGLAPDIRAVLLENQSIVMARVGQLSTIKRQLLVLTLLEGFTLPEAATVVGIAPQLARELLAQGKRELRAQPSSRILIIEDEPVIALDIATTVRQSGHRVVAIAANHQEAVAAADKEAPELILADVQLENDGSGLEAVREILHGRSVPVVFITAFPERLLTRGRPETTFLITKPFDPETLRVSISQALWSAAQVHQPVLQ